jgi:hypothetical protein
VKRIKLISPLKGVPEGGETVMIDRAGIVYSTIAGLYHPPVTIRRTEISETINWIYSHGLEGLFDKHDIYSWLRIIIANTLLTAKDMDSCDDRDIWTMFITRNHECCDEFWAVAEDMVEEVKAMDKTDWETLNEENKDVYEQAIITVINNNFLRVRAGGKYRPEDDNHVIYFIVTSKDFNWLEVISGFLKKTFRSKNHVPDIWIGTDRRGIGREILYYEGTGNIKYMGGAVMGKNSIELLREQLEEMNDCELAVLWEQYLRFEKSDDTEEQPLRTFLDIQNEAGQDLCPRLTISTEIMREITTRWSREHLGTLKIGGESND